MNKLSKIICLIVLCVFTFTASAGSLLRCCNMSDKINTQQNTDKNTLETANNNCHDDKNNSPDTSSNECCQNMSLCNGSVLFIADSALISVQIVHQTLTFPQNEQLAFNISIPLRRPPKLIH